MTGRVNNNPNRLTFNPTLICVFFMPGSGIDCIIRISANTVRTEQDRKCRRG